MKANDVSQVTANHARAKEWADNRIGLHPASPAFRLGPPLSVTVWSDGFQGSYAYPVTPEEDGALRETVRKLADAGDVVSVLWPIAGPGSALREQHLVTFTKGDGSPIVATSARSITSQPQEYSARDRPGTGAWRNGLGRGEVASALTDLVRDALGAWNRTPVATRDFDHLRRADSRGRDLS